MTDFAADNSAQAGRPVRSYPPIAKAQDGHACVSASGPTPPVPYLPDIGQLGMNRASSQIEIDATLRHFEIANAGQRFELLRLIPREIGYGNEHTLTLALNRLGLLPSSSLISARVFRPGEALFKFIGTLAEGCGEDGQATARAARVLLYQSRTPIYLRELSALSMARETTQFGRALEVLQVQACSDEVVLLARRISAGLKVSTALLPGGIGVHLQLERGTSIPVSEQECLSGFACFIGTAYPVPLLVAPAGETLEDRAIYNHEMEHLYGHLVSGLYPDEYTLEGMMLHELRSLLAEERVWGSAELMGLFLRYLDKIVPNRMAVAQATPGGTAHWVEDCKRFQAERVSFLEDLRVATESCLGCNAARLLESFSPLACAFRSATTFVEIQAVCKQLPAN